MYTRYTKYITNDPVKHDGNVIASRTIDRAFGGEKIYYLRCIEYSNYVVENANHHNNDHG